MAERSKQVEYRMNNGEAVVASGTTHRDIIAGAAAEKSTASRSRTPRS